MAGWNFMKKQTIRKVIIFLFWLLVWQAAAMMIHNSILLAGPYQVLKELFTGLQKADFYKTVLMSLIRITGGFLLGLFTGMLLGILAFFQSMIEEILSPVIALLKAIPIASFVVLLLIWTGSKYLAVYISVLVVFPNVYLHTIAGLKNADVKLLEMTKVFQLSFAKKFSYLYVPAMLPFLVSCIEISIGMSFKSGVAAEVIGTPEFSFGERLYMAKIQLNTAGVFAWTIVVIIVSYGIEKGVLYLLSKWKQKHIFQSRKRRYHAKKKEVLVNDSMEDIEIKGLTKSYQEKNLFNQLDLRLKKGKVYCLMGPSGCGKTTFLHILLGLIKPDSGMVMGVEKERIVAVFQESRLFEEFKAIDNAFLFGTLSKGNEWEWEEFRRLLPIDALDKPTKELSGGMQRRVAILRAMNAKASVIVMDEPFSGLDEEMKRKTAAYILERKGNKTLIISTHNKEDVELLKGEIIDGNESSFNWNYG